MARIIGGVTSSHIPAVGNAIANNLQQEPYWKRFFDGYEPAKAWLRERRIWCWSSAILDRCEK